jgi:plastocyanin
MHRRPFPIALAVCALAVTATAACGASDTGKNAGPAATSTPSSSAPPTSSAPAASQSVITIKDFGFETPASVPAGATVMVKNDDGTAHSVTGSGSGSFDVVIQPHATATFTAPDKAGKYRFVCKFHGNMKGTLTVA